jgi:protein-S-isoprenylcysteine O-methyltransferase Ste14
MLKILPPIWFFVFLGVALALHFLVLNFVFIPFEENKLTGIFGGQYAEYNNSVRRWI